MTTTPTTDNTDLPIDIPEVDKTSPDAEAVAAFLEAQNSIKPTPQDEAISNILSGDGDDGEKKEKEKEEAPAWEGEKDDYRVHLHTDLTFKEDKRAAIDNLFISVQDTDIPVTDEDKVLYLKATLNNVPVRLSVDMANGVSVECRSLSVYEGDLVYDALGMYLKQYPDLNAALWEGFVQQYRVTMQLTRVNSRAVDFLSFEYEPGKREEHAKQLLETSNAQLLNTQGTLFGIYVRALNVFQHKITRLQEAAFNQDFWKPADID